MAGALREGSQGVGHPYLTALLLLAIIGGFYVSGGNNLSTIKPTPNSGVVTVMPEALDGTRRDNLQLYTFGHIVENPAAPGSPVPSTSDPDPQDPNQPLPDCPSHGEKTATCQCPVREETWAYCPAQATTTCADGGVLGSAPVPGTDPNQKYCVYQQDLDSPAYQQRLNDPACRKFCVN